MMGLFVMFWAETAEAVRLVLTQKLLTNLKFGALEGLVSGELHTEGETFRQKICRAATKHASTPSDRGTVAFSFTGRSLCPSLSLSVSVCLSVCLSLPLSLSLTLPASLAALCLTASTPSPCLLCPPVLDGANLHAVDVGAGMFPRAAERTA